MARITKRLFLLTADATPEDAFTSSAGETTKMTELIVAQPAGAAATIIRLSLGNDAAGTRIFEETSPTLATAKTYFFYPGFVISGTEKWQLSSTVTDDVAIVTANGYTDKAT